MYGFGRMHWCPVEGCYSKTVILHFRILRFPRFHKFLIWYWPNAHNNDVCWVLRFPEFYAILVDPHKKCKILILLCLEFTWKD